MDHKNPINGSAPTNMLAIGKIIKKMVLEFNTIKMVINMKGDGLRARGTGKEHFGCVIQRIN